MITDDSFPADSAVNAPRRRAAHRFYAVRLSARDAWSGATIAAVFNLLGMALEIAVIGRIPGVSATPAIVSAAVALLLLLALFVWRKTPSARVAFVIYSATTVSVVAVLLSTNPQFASAGDWVPFQAHKLGCLVAALIAPGFWVGLVSILAYASSAVIQLEFFFPPELRAQVDPSEPLPLIAFGLAGVLALIYRFRRVELEQEVARVQAQNLAIRRLATAFLNIRDLMNTPLQVIELSVGLLRHSKEPAQPVLDRIERSVQSLREVNTMLARHEKEIEWQSSGPS